MRLRLGSQISHCELVFEPGDGVDDLMPDGTCAPVPIGNGGLYWAGSSAAAEPIPPWSPRRAGSKGGIRFKRLDVDACIGAQPQWLLVDVPWADDVDKGIRDIPAMRAAYEAAGRSLVGG